MYCGGGGKGGCSCDIRVSGLGLGDSLYEGKAVIRLGAILEGLDGRDVGGVGIGGIGGIGRSRVTPALEPRRGSPNPFWMAAFVW